MRDVVVVRVVVEDVTGSTELRGVPREDVDDIADAAPGTYVKFL